MAPTVHMIAQAHLDPVWLWRWTEGRAEALATSRSAVDRLHEFPDLHVVRGETQVYEWIEQEDPALFAEIRELIAAGRWHVVNGMVVQPDMNLPQGEALVRTALLGKAYMRERLGVDVRIAYCVDSFGHAGTLPQILKKCGFDYYVFMRPGHHEKTIPAQAFRWRGPDGSEILTFRIPFSYTTRTPDVEKKVDDTVADMPPQLSDTMCFFGVGNHGGGPTVEQIRGVAALAGRRQDLHIIFSSPQAYFARIATRALALPVLDDELQMHAIGCYSLNSHFKRLYRQAESALLGAERMACLAELWAQQPPPRQRLDALWHELAFNQFHDILAASSIKEGQDDANMALGGVITAARALADDAGRGIAARVETAGPGGTVVMFNPFPYQVQSYVEYEPWLGWESWQGAGWGLADDAGRPVPHQLVEPQSALNCQRVHLARLVFPVDLPPLGYRVYRFAHGIPAAPIPAQATARLDGLENDMLALRVDPATGDIVSCRHKASGVELAGAGGWNVPQVLEDTSDTWSHGETAFEKVVGRFAQASVRVGETGPLQASLYIERRWEQSVWLQQLIVRAGVSEILVRNWLHWQGRQRVVKLAFTLAASAVTARRDVPFGSFACPTDGREMPLQMWLGAQGRAATGQIVGLALLNDGKYGGDVQDATLRLTILRCPPYAYDRIHTLGEKARYDWVDQGLQEFTLALRPHLGDWRDAGIVQRARELNLSLQAVTMHCHAGVLPPANSLAVVDSDEIELTALKPAQAGYGYIVRLADRHGRGGQGRLTWLDASFPVAVAPHEVITLHLEEQDGRWSARPCNMIEQG